MTAPRAIDIKASHERIAARFPIILAGLGDVPVQPLLCEVCEEPTTAGSFIASLRMVICPLCLEGFIANQSMEKQP
jgi:hypothetical protein